MYESTLHELRKSLLKDNSDFNRKRWANHIVENNIELKSLFELVYDDARVASGFIWLVGDLCEIKPEIVFPTVTLFFTNRDKIKIRNYNRSLAKMFRLCGIPDKIEGEATSEMFNWLNDPNVIVTTKNYSLMALNNLSKKHPVLKRELKLIIEDQLDKNPVSFAKCAQKILSDPNSL